jgi:hypothetical protein
MSFLKSLRGQLVSPPLLNNLERMNGPRLGTCTLASFSKMVTGKSLRERGCNSIQQMLDFWLFDIHK